MEARQALRRGACVICASLFPGDLKGIKPWLMKVPLSGPLNIGCMVSACPQGGGVGSPCSTSPTYDFASQEKPGYLGTVSSWSCSPTYPEGLSDPLSRCKVEVHAPPPLVSACRVVAWTPSLETHLRAQALPLSSWASQWARLSWSDLQKQRNSFCFRA